MKLLRATALETCPRAQVLFTLVVAKPVREIILESYASVKQLWKVVFEKVLQSCSWNTLLETFA